MKRPFRLGLLTHLRGTASPQQAYQEALALFDAADQLGFDVGWVAQHHFTDTAGYLPSPFPFLAAVSQRTQRLRLGTSIVVLPLEMPLRVAEDAAVVDLLSQGRLELGVGSGSDPREFAAFQRDMSSRHPQTTAGLETLKRAFRGDPLAEPGQQLQPAAPTLVERLWLSGLSELGAQYAAKHQVGLLLSRAAWGKDEPTDVIQLPIAQTYLDSWQQPAFGPRLGLSRGIYVAADKQTALAEMGRDILQATKRMVAQNRIPAGLSLEAYCQRMHIAYGHPEEVAEMLGADQVLPHATDLILQFDPVFPTLAQAINMLEQIATNVAPILGWQPKQ